jgi:type IV secretion system protein TrbC
VNNRALLKSIMALPSRRVPPVLGFAALFLLTVFAPEAAMASTTSAMPWAGPLQSLEADLSGPTAGVICIVAIVGAGSMLIFGNHEFSGFVKTIFYIVIVIAFIVGAHAFLNTFGGSGALV